MRTPSRRASKGCAPTWAAHLGHDFSRHHPQPIASTRGHAAPMPPNLQGARAGSGLFSERAMLGARGTRGRATDQLVLELGTQRKQAMQQSYRRSLGTIGAFGFFFFRRLYKRPDHPVSHPFGMILVMGSDLIPCTDTAKQQLPGGISPTDHPLRASWTRYIHR